MKQVTLTTSEGRMIQAFMPEDEKDLQKQIDDVKKQNIKEHLYIGYLIVGTIAFALGIFISLKRLNGSK